MPRPVPDHLMPRELAALIDIGAVQAFHPENDIRQPALSIYREAAGQPPTLTGSLQKLRELSG